MINNKKYIQIYIKIVMKKLKKNIYIIFLII